MRAEVYGNQSPDSQSSSAFFFALNKATNTRKYSRPCVDSFLTVTIKSKRRAWRYTSYSTGSTHNYSPRTRDHPTGIALIPPSTVGSLDQLHRHRFGRTRPWVRLCRFSCVLLDGMCTECIEQQWKPFKHWHWNQFELTAYIYRSGYVNRDRGVWTGLTQKS